MNVQSFPGAALHSEERAHEADHPSSLVAKFGVDQPLRLDCGIDLAPFQIAYQTYGQLNAARSNAILVFHALTGDQHVANIHPVTGKPGWWETMVGPGRPIDPDRYFVICPNVLGACMGTTGPASTNPSTAMPWGLDFPVITIRETHKKIMSRPVTSTSVGRNFSRSGVVVTSPLQPTVENAHKADENHVSSTSLSCVSSRPPAFACASSAVRAT